MLRGVGSIPAVVGWEPPCDSTCQDVVGRRPSLMRTCSFADNTMPYYLEGWASCLSPRRGCACEESGPGRAHLGN